MVACAAVIAKDHMETGQASRLDSVTLLAGLTAVERAWIASRCRYHDYPVRSNIFEQEDDADAVYFVLSGSIQLKSYSAGGQEVYFDVIGAGETFGEKAALDQLPHENTAVAVEATMIASLSIRDFNQAFDDFPKLARAVTRGFCEKIRLGHERVMDLGTVAANNRVHAEVLRLAREQEPDENDVYVISPAPQHAEVSYKICAARETVSRAFGEMAKLGITQKVKGGLAVVDLDRLEEMVEFAKSGERRTGLDRRTKLVVVEKSYRTGSDRRQA